MHRFQLICGPDEFLVQRAGAEAWAKLKTGVDEFSCEVINGFAGQAAEIEQAVRLFRDAVTTLDLLGNRKVVWFKDVNFLADSPVGRTKAAEAGVELMQTVLENAAPESVGILITAAPVDRRKTAYKWLNEHGDTTFIGAAEGDAGIALMETLARDEASRLGCTFEPSALRLLLERTDGNTRILIQEIGKLAAFAADSGGNVTEDMVEELTPNFAEGDFFEAAEMFFRRKLEPTVEAIRRHFFTGQDARPLLSSLQNRCRLLLQIRALMDAGILSDRGINKASLEKVSQRFSAAYAGVTEKSGFYLPSQHPFYLSQLTDSARLFSVPELLTLQLEFVEIFRRINSPSEEPEAVFRDLAVRHLAKS